jgi:hypothetical protein
MNSSMTGREVRRLVDDYIGTVDGYLKHFSYSSHEAFYRVGTVELNIGRSPNSRRRTLGLPNK